MPYRPKGRKQAGRSTTRRRFVAHIHVKEIPKVRDRLDAAVRIIAKREENPRLDRSDLLRRKIREIIKEAGLKVPA